MYIKHLKKLFNFLTHIFSLDETEKYCPQEGEIGRPGQVTTSLGVDQEAVCINSNHTPLVQT